MTLLDHNSPREGGAEFMARSRLVEEKWKRSVGSTLKLPANAVFGTITPLP